MPNMTPTSPIAAVTPRAGKIIENGLNVFEKDENLL